MFFLDINGDRVDKQLTIHGLFMEISRVVWRTPYDFMGYELATIWFVDVWTGRFNPRLWLWRNPKWTIKSSSGEHHDPDGSKNPLPQHFVLEHLVQTHVFLEPQVCVPSTLIQHLVYLIFLVRSLVPSTAFFRIRMARRCFQHPMANPRYNCGPPRHRWRFLSRENHRTNWGIFHCHDPLLGGSPPLSK